MTIATQWPNRLLSLQDWQALPPDEAWCLELVEGVLQMVPRPLAMHQRATLRLGAELDQQLPAHLTALADVEVVLSSGDRGGLATVRVPDLIVISNELAEQNPARFQARDVLIAIEIVSPGTGRTDRVMKLAEYAEVGIPHYWIIELGPPVQLSTYRLTEPGAPYQAGTSGSGTMVLTEPAPVTLDLDALTSR